MSEKATDTAARRRPWITRPCTREVSALIAFLGFIGLAIAFDLARGDELGVGNELPIALMVGLIVAYGPRRGARRRY